MRNEELKREIKEEMVEHGENVIKDIKSDRENVKKLGLHSMRFKIVLMVLFGAILSSGLLVLKLVPDFKTTYLEQSKNTLYSLAVAYGRMVDYEEAQAGEQLSYEGYTDVLSEVRLKGFDSSYAYYIAYDGTMLYHPTQDEVGKKVENSVAADLVADLQAGKALENAVVEYEYKGTTKYASYYITDNKNLLFVTADEDDILAGVNRMISVAVGTLICVIILVLALVAFISKWMVRPLIQITEIVGETAKFRLMHNPASEKICARKDESGVMGRAVRDMRANLRTMVLEIEEASRTITGNVQELQEKSNQINSMCTDNSATTQELAAGMEETSATTETISNNIGYMQTGANGIRDLAVEGDRLSNEVMNRAEDLKLTTEDASMRTEKMYENVKAKTAQAIEDSKSVEKINELTEAIMSISSQTSLLALNASIEAARAGEAGKGFAVVATEIGNLARQTSQTVTDINEIVKEVNAAVANMSESLVESTEFLDTTVLKDYGQFKEIGEQYTQDATIFKDSMNSIRESVTSLADTIAEISEALNGISSTVSEATSGVTDIAEKTTGVVAKTVENADLVDASIDKVSKLDKAVSMFKL